jgi:hypothetical protein
MGTLTAIIAGAIALVMLAVSDHPLDEGCALCEGSGHTTLEHGWQETGW